jgi:hypothetical protein
VINCCASPSGRSAQILLINRESILRLTGLSTLLVFTGLILDKGRCSSDFASLACARFGSATLPSLANLRKSLSQARLIRSGNVVDRRPLGAIRIARVRTVPARPASGHGRGRLIKINVYMID